MKKLFAMLMFSLFCSFPAFAEEPKMTDAVSLMDGLILLDSTESAPKMVKTSFEQNVGNVSATEKSNNDSKYAYYMLFIGVCVVGQYLFFRQKA